MNQNNYQQQMNRQNVSQMYQQYQFTNQYPTPIYYQINPNNYQQFGIPAEIPQYTMQMSQHTPQQYTTQMPSQTQQQYATQMPSQTPQQYATQMPLQTPQQYTTQMPQYTIQMPISIPMQQQYTIQMPLQTPQQNTMQTSQ